MFATILLQYASTAIAMPFEVGKTLLQVQYVPKDGPEPADSSEIELELEQEQDTVSYMH